MNPAFRCSALLLGLGLGLILAGPVLAQGPMQPSPPPADAPQTPEAVERALLDGLAYAKAQLAAGHYETMRIGPAASPQENAHITAIERQGVFVIQLGEMPSAGLVAYADANNAVMDAAIRQKYGPDFWDRVEQQAPMPGMPPYAPGR